MNFIKHTHVITQQMKLFPASICPVWCPDCQQITIHFWGKTKSQSPLRLVCNQCGLFLVMVEDLSDPDSYSFEMVDYKIEID